MNNVLLDSDVILDFFFDRKPYSDFATKIFELSEFNNLNTFVTPIIYSNLYYILRQTAKHEIVIENLKMLNSITKVLKTDEEVVYNALNSNFRDFEDALQNYSAENYKEIKYILTRNKKDYKYSSLIVLSPKEFLNEFGYMR